ncbi:MAG: hypothetical protein IH595_01505 [Bacteroidales bacterium]|nr:hypothetical protein [Bacteroidales bacterium]
MSLIVVIVFSLTNCEKANIQRPGQKVYFQYNYINFAWGFQHSGWLIDSSGNVYCYNKPEGWNYSDSTGIITHAQMDSNLSATSSVCYKIDKNVLKEKIKLLYVASKGKISEPSQEAYDAGAWEYSGYIYDSEKKIYKKVLLKQAGDIGINNSSPAAVQLSNWFDSINYSIYHGKR